MSRKFWTLYRFNLTQKLKAKSFLITTVLMLLFVAAFSNFERIVDWFQDEPTLAVVSSLDTDITPLLEQAGYDGKIIKESYTESEARAAVMNDDVDAVAIISGEPFAANLLSKSPEGGVQSQLSAALKQLKDASIIEEAQIAPEVLAQIAAPVPVKQTLTATGGKSEEELFAASGLVYVLIFLMYFTIALYGGMIVTEVANEKSSRVMELLISAASPVEHMFAKILSIATASLIQLSLFVAFGYYSASRTGMLDNLSLDSLSASTFIYLFVFFILGYLLYATILASLGSLVSRVEDAQQVTLPVILLLVAAFMISMFSLNSPANQAVTVLSFVPFFTPMVMFLRVMLTDVPAWQIALSLGLMVASITLAVFIGTRFYRGGVLFYGSNPVKQLRRILASRE